MLFGIMPYLMKIEFDRLLAETKTEIEELEHQIKHLKKVISYDVEDIAELQRRVVALGGDPDTGLRARLLGETAMPTRDNGAGKRKL